MMTFIHDQIDFAENLSILYFTVKLEIESLNIIETLR